ncbi:MAG: hypothetical protein NVS1B4_01650 [Gemmatimonadaceae bacterium]
MNRRMLFAALVGSGLAASAGAQTTASGTATLTVATTLYISVTNLNPTFAPTATDFNTGSMTAATSSSVISKGNVSHSIALTSGAATWTGVGALARTNKPSTDLQVQITPFGGAAGAWTGVSTTTFAVASGRAAGDYTASPIAAGYRALLAYNADTPGTYTLPITYTVTSP